MNNWNLAPNWGDRFIYISVIIKFVTDIKEHEGNLNNLDEILESANNVWHDRLEHRRR